MCERGSHRYRLPAAYRAEMSSDADDGNLDGEGPGASPILDELLWRTLAAESRRLGEDFDHASELGEGTSQEVSDFRENAFRALVRRYFPASSHVTKGQIRGVDGSKSASIDCVVANPVHPHMVDAELKFAVLFADAIDFAVEVKGRLDGDELLRGLRQTSSVRRVRRSRSPVLLPGKRPELAEAGHYIPTFIYCHTSALQPATIATQVRDWVESTGVPPLERPDAIVVHGSGIYAERASLTSPIGDLSERTRLGDQWEGVQHQQCWLELGERTLGYALLNLSLAMPAIPSMGPPILPRYLVAPPVDVEVVGEYGS